mmetsp:Transcript_3946/g.5787  ORF Transcript_3946/g.5787 Transcript_3946/m.5787 type:complete len:144 (+) Transcript_3946:144-575(+)
MLFPMTGQEGAAGGRGKLTERSRAASEFGENMRRKLTASHATAAQSVALLTKGSADATEKGRAAREEPAPPGMERTRGGEVTAALGGLPKEMVSARCLRAAGTRGVKADAYVPQSSNSGDVAARRRKRNISKFATVEFRSSKK